MTYLAISCRCLLGSVFLVSAVTKISGRASFQAYARSVRRLGVSRPAFAAAAPAALVTCELAVAAQLASPLRAVAVSGFAVALALLAVFSAAIVRSLSRDEREPCRCFGAAGARLGWRHVVRNAALAGFALLGIPGTVTPGGDQPAGYAVAAVIGLVVGLMITQADRFMELIRPREPYPSGHLPGQEGA